MPPKAKESKKSPTKSELEAEIAALEDQLAILSSVGEDTFNIGTIMVFSMANPVAHWYYAKTAEETWLDVKSGEEQPLANWILDTVYANVGYFEVYELRAQPLPFYASS